MLSVIKNPSLTVHITFICLVHFCSGLNIIYIHVCNPIIYHLQKTIGASQMPRTPAFPSCKWGNLPAFLWHFSEARPLLLTPPRNSESRPSSEMTRSTKTAAPVKRFISILYLYYVGHFNVDFKCSYTLDYSATLFRPPIYALHGLAVRAIQFQVVLFAFELVC